MEVSLLEEIDEFEGGLQRLRGVGVKHEGGIFEEIERGHMGIDARNERFQEFFVFCSEIVGFVVDGAEFVGGHIKDMSAGNGVVFVFRREI